MNDLNIKMRGPNIKGIIKMNNEVIEASEKI